MTTETRVVIVGGGAMGAALLYFLAHEGWTDTILVEKGELNSGSTWHAAGMIPNFTSDFNLAKVHEVGVSLYRSIEAETGLATGWHEPGTVRLCRKGRPEEADWHRYTQGLLHQAGVECHIIGPSEIAELHPLLNLDDVVSGAYTPNDGWADPSSCTNSMARGARRLGAEIRRHTRVTDMNQLPDGRWEVICDNDRIICEHVVNAAGHYAPQLGAMVGLDVPIVSVIHQYLVT
ncbi:MAG: FAD-dependent oxidoreductase, partial [bacterium]|nr:FAD-dependent oxidoreductase [bacterium]